MELIRDVLDKQLRDRKLVKIGKVDGLVATKTARGRPRVAFIEIGSRTLARRLGVRVKSRRSVPFRIPWEKIIDIEVDIDVDIDVKKTPLNAWREKLRKHILDLIPGT